MIRMKNLRIKPLFLCMSIAGLRDFAQIFCVLPLDVQALATHIPPQQPKHEVIKWKHP